MKKMIYFAAFAIMMAMGNVNAFAKSNGAKHSGSHMNGNVKVEVCIDAHKHHKLSRHEQKMMEERRRAEERRRLEEQRRMEERSRMEARHRHHHHEVVAADAGAVAGVAAGVAVAALISALMK